MVQRKFDARHEFFASGRFAVYDSLTTRSATIIPIIMNDDAQGDPMNFKAHPEHASWSEVPYPNCFPDSEIRNMRITLDLYIASNLSAISSVVKLNYGLISCAFPEDLDALDEKSGLTLKTILELQKETTDRQVYPLWSAIDLSSSSDLHANVPGLTTDQALEGVNFGDEVLRDQLRYGRVKGLIKKCMPIGFRTAMIRGRSVAGYTKRLTFNFTPSNAKFINPYTFLGLLLHCPQSVSLPVFDSSRDQPIQRGDLTLNTEFVNFGVHVQYNERNPEFHMGKV